MNRARKFNILSMAGLVVATPALAQERPMEAMRIYAPSVDKMEASFPAFDLQYAGKPPIIIRKDFRIKSDVSLGVEYRVERIREKGFIVSERFADGQGIVGLGTKRGVSIKVKYDF